MLTIREIEFLQEALVKSSVYNDFVNKQTKEQYREEAIKLSQKLEREKDDINFHIDNLF